MMAMNSAGSDCRSSMNNTSEFVSLIKFNGEPILPPLLTSEQREEMRRYRHQAVMLESKLRASTQQKLLLMLQTTVQEINEQHCCVPTVPVRSDDDYCQGGTELRRCLSAAFSHTESSQAERQYDQHYETRKDRSDHVACLIEMNVSDVKEASSPDDTIVANPDVVASSCISSLSPDSGFHSKAVFDSVITSQLAMTKPVDITSLQERLLKSNLLATLTCNKESGEGTEECQMVNETDVVQSTLVIDDDDQSTMTDVRSSVLSTSTDDTVNLTVVKSHHSQIVADELLTSVGNESDTCHNLPGISGSAAENDAVCTRAVGHIEYVHSEPGDVSGSVELQNSSRFIDSSPFDELAEGQMLSGDPIVTDSMVPEYDSCEAVVDRMKNNLLAEIYGKDLEGSSVGRDLRSDEKTETKEPITTDHNQYLTAADTSYDSQTLDTVADDLHQIRNLMAAINMFSEENDHRIESSGGSLHAHTRSVSSQSNHSLPSSQSCSPEISANKETRRYSYTARILPPRYIITEQLDGSHLQEQRYGNCKNLPCSPIPLTASMEDLNLRPGKKLEFDGLPVPSPQSYYLDPPDEYQDHLISTENGSSLVPPRHPVVNLNAQAKKDRLQWYLKSLAIMPGCDDTQDGLHGHASCQDISHTCRSDRESTELPCHEHHTSLLVPELVHQSDVIAELTEGPDIQLQHYEILKQRLMEDHRQSLERLFAEQEQQMAELQSRLMGQTQTMSCQSVVVAAEHSTSEPQSSDVSGTFCGQMVQVLHCSTLSQNQQSPDRHLTSSVDDLSSSYKTRSPAGVLCSHRRVISHDSSCSTIHSDSTESDFLHKSPAVLCSGRLVIPVSSPRDNSRTQPESHPVPINDSCSSLGHLTVLDHRLDRRVVDMYAEPLPDDIQKKCEKLSAAVKGYLTRRLFRTEKIQSIIKIIWDTVEFALQFQKESPIKNGRYSAHDRFVHERVLAQLNSAIYEFHEIFFDIPVAARMHYITQERTIQLEKCFKSKGNSAEKSRRISAVTRKTVERRKTLSCKKTDTSLKVDAIWKTSDTVEKPSCTVSLSRHSLGKTVRPSRLVSSPHKPVKDQVRRMVMREKSRISGGSSRVITTPSRPRQNKSAKRVNTGGQMSNPSVIKPTRKIASGSSSVRKLTASKLCRSVFEPVTSSSSTISHVYRERESPITLVCANKSAIASQSG